GRRYDRSTWHRRNPRGLEGRRSTGEARLARCAMCANTSAVLSIGLIATVIVMAQASKIDFDKDEPGKPPAGWTATQTGTGAAKWAVTADPTAPSPPNVLRQSGTATYPVCLRDDSHTTDGFVETRFKPISGKEDQAGGLVWRAKDANNYYVARANALEDNVTIYHTINGRRTEKKRVSMKVASNQWHALRVDFEGSHFTVT